MVVNYEGETIVTKSTILRRGPNASSLLIELGVSYVRDFTCLAKGPVINSSRGGGGRHLGGGTKILHTQREGGMKNKEHFNRNTLEFFLKSCSGDQNICINLRGETKTPSNI